MFQSSPVRALLLVQFPVSFCHIHIILYHSTLLLSDTTHFVYFPDQVLQSGILQGALLLFTRKWYNINI